jgi:hypothetical protein
LVDFSDVDIGLICNHFFSTPILLGFQRIDE